MKNKLIVPLILSMLNAYASNYHYVDIDSVLWQDWQTIIEQNNVQAAHDYIAHTPNISVARILDSMNHESLLVSAVKQQRPELVSMLIKAGCNVNFNMRRGISFDSCLLIEAISNDDASIVKQLIRAGADVDFKASESRYYTGRYTPLTCAVRLKKYECVKLLMSAGASINNKDRNQKTPLMYACQDLQMLQLILSYSPHLFLTDAHDKSVMEFLKNFNNIDQLNEAQKLLYRKHVSEFPQKKYNVDDEFFCQLMQTNLTILS